MNNKLLLLFFFMMNVVAQEKEVVEETYFLNDVLGRTGLTLFIGLMFFFFSYKNAVKLFAWIEDQTYGTRDYVLKKCELLYYDIEPNKVTYILVYLSVVQGILVFGLFTLMGKITTGIFFGLIVNFIGWKAPRPLMDFLVQMRIKKYSLQMVDALNLLANGLRAGLSMPQAIGMVVDELPNPVSQEFNTILQNTRIGVPLEEALEGLVARVPTEDNDMFVTSVNILRETGGNLAEVFDTIIDVIRERVRLKQKIDTYVAQGLFQGLVIFMMPTGITLLFAASDPKSIAPLFNTTFGIIMLCVALAFNLAGGYAIVKIVRIKV